MPYQPWRVINVQDPEEGGEPIGVLDLEDRTIQVGMKLKIKNVSAAYTIDPEDSGSLITIDTAATLTLPAATQNLKGVYVDVMVIADVTVVIAAATAGQLIMSNDIAANSFTWSTGSQKVGEAVRLVCNGASWLVMMWPITLTGATTVGTVSITT